MFDGTLFAGAIDEMVEGHFLRMYDQYNIICYSVRTFQIPTGTLLVAQSNCWSLIGQGWKDTSQF